MTYEAKRKDFEAWLTNDWQYEHEAHRDIAGNYIRMRARIAWEAWQAAARAAVPAWQPIETAPKSEATSFMVLRKGVAIQVSWFEGRLYPDAREACIDWEDGITDATHWSPLPPAPEESHDRENRFVNA